MPSDREGTEMLAERSSVVEGRSLSSPPQVAAGAAALEPEPPWRPGPEITPIEREAFAVYPHYLAAHIVSGVLENEGLLTVVKAWTAFPGVASATLGVPRHLMHAARLFDPDEDIQALADTVPELVFVVSAASLSNAPELVRSANTRFIWRDRRQRLRSAPARRAPGADSAS